MHSITVVDPIKKRKKELEDERLPEFAPPVSYYKGEKSTFAKHIVDSTTSSTTTDDDSVYNSVNTEFGNYASATQYQLPPLFSYPTPSASANNPVTETADSIRRNTGVFVTSRAEYNINNTDTMDCSAQKPNDTIRESVSEVLRYYKSKYV